MDRQPALERIAHASGILFAIGQIVATAYFVGVLAPHLPPLDAPLEEQSRFYTQYASENALVAYLYVLPVPFFLLFLGGLTGVLRRLERGAGVLTTTAMAAGVCLAITWPIGIIVADSGQGMAQHGLGALAVMAFDGVAQLSLALSTLPQSVFLLAIGGAVLTSRLLPRAVGWTAIGLALVALVGSATLIDAGLYPIAALGNLLFDLWVAVLGGMLLRRVAADSHRHVVESASLAAA